MSPRSNNHLSSTCRHSLNSQALNHNHKDRKLCKALKLRSQFMKQLILLSVTIESEQAKLSTLRQELAAYSQRSQREDGHIGRKGKCRGEDNDQEIAYTTSKETDNGKQKQEPTDVNNIIDIHDNDERKDGSDKALKTFLAKKSKICEQERKIARLSKDVDLVRLKQKEVFKIIWEDRGMVWERLGED